MEPPTASESCQFRGRERQSSPEKGHLWKVIAQAETRDASPFTPSLFPVLLSFWGRWKVKAVQGKESRESGGGGAGGDAEEPLLCCRLWMQCYPPGCRCPPENWTQALMPQLQAFLLQIHDFALSMHWYLPTLA